MKEHTQYPRLVFYKKKTTVNPYVILSKEKYDELHELEPMQYLPENWTYYNKNQINNFNDCQKALDDGEFVLHVCTLAVSSYDEFLKEKKEVEKEDGFAGWFDEPQQPLKTSV